MKTFAQLAPILLSVLIAAPAGAEPSAFGGAAALTGEPASEPANATWTEGKPLAAGLARERYRLDARYPRAPESPWYGFVGGEFDRDSLVDGEARSVWSTGPGYRFYENDELRLSLQGGLSYSENELRDRERRRFAGLNWGFNWEQTFFDQHLNFFHRHRGNQSLESRDNLTINAETGVKVPLASGFSATATYDLQWEGSAYDDARNADHSYTLGLGYDW